MKFCIVASILALILTVACPVLGSRANDQENPALPFEIPAEQVRPLRQHLDKPLQQSLEKRLKADRVWSRLIASKKMAVGVVDLADSLNIKFARVNGDVMLYAASLPKLAVLLATADALEKGFLAETPEILDDMHHMIQMSDNAAASRLIEQLGFERIAAVLEDPHYELYDVKRGGGLWVGKAFSKRGKRYPDPLMGISHGASVTQVCRFYYLLAMGRLVSRERSTQMLEMLKDPALHHKFVSTYDRIVPDAVLYRKSGTWRTYHADSVLVWGPVWRRYILVALVDDKDGEQILRNLIPAVEEILRAQPPATR